MTLFEDGSGDRIFVIRLIGILLPLLEGFAGFDLLDGLCFLLLLGRWWLFCVCAARRASSSRA